MPYRRQQADFVERVLGMLPRLASAGEVGLERLGRELDDAVAVDPARPAADLVLDRREHAELHGSVWTITSAISGCSRRIRSSTSLARVCASANEVEGSSPSVR